MTCPNCKQEVDKVKTVIKSNGIHSGCDICLPTLLQGHSLAAKYTRDRMKEDYRKDIIQPVDTRDYAKAYPKQFIEKFGEENYRKYS